MPRSATRVTFLLHTVLGLGIGTLLMALGISGSVLVFRPEIERALYPSLLTVTASSDGIRLDESVKAVEATSPDGRLVAVRLPQSPAQPLEFTVRPQTGAPSRIYVNPYTAQVMGVRSRDWIGIVHDFHHDLFAERTGRVALGVVAWATVLLSVTGGLTLLQRKRALKSAVAMPGTMRNSHILFGLVALPILFVTAVSATSFTWGKQYSQLLKKFDNTPQFETPRATAPTKSISLAAILESAQASVPDARPTIIRFPAKPLDPVVVRLHGPGDLRDIGSTQVFVDASTNKVLLAVESSQRSTSTRILESSMPLHTGEFGGIIFRVLWSVVGFSPAFLFISGLVIWTRRTWPRRATAAVSSSPEVAVSLESL